MGRADRPFANRSGTRPQRPEDHLSEQKFLPRPGTHRGFTRPRKHPAVESPGHDGDEHEQIACNELHVGKGSPVAAGQNQDDAGKRYRGAEHLHSARSLAVPECADAQGPDRQTRGDQRDIDGRRGLERQILKRVIAAYTEQAEQREVAHAIPQRTVRTQDLLAERQKDRAGQKPSQRVEEQGRDRSDGHPSEHGIARPQQRRDHQQERGTSSETGRHQW